MGFKKLLKPRVIAWAATTVVLVGVLIAANYVCNNVISSLLDATVFGGKRPIIDKDAEGIPFEQDFATKAEAFENGNKVTEEICEEGMVLLKNEIMLFLLRKTPKLPSLVVTPSN